MREIHVEQLESLMPIMRERFAAGQSICIAPRGISMLPLIRQGKDSVILSPVTDRLKKYDIPLYQRKNGKYVLHRIVEVGETYTCLGDSQFRFERGIEHSQVIAVVTTIRRGNKTISVTSKGYRVYCLLWNGSFPLRYFAFRVVRKLKSFIK